MEENQVQYLAALASIVHRLELWRQEVGLVEPVWPDWQPDPALAKVADQAAALVTDSSVKIKNATTLSPLRPILGQVTLGYEVSAVNQGYMPQDIGLDIEHEELDSVSVEAYRKQWHAFVTACKAINLTGDHFQSGDLVTLLALLHKHLALLPATQSTPEVSLYDNLRVTAAIAVCLMRTHLGEEPEAAPIATMVRGDFSGIQKFIYHITRSVADASFRGVAKRLRGRSFYLSLLGDIVTDWLIQELELTPANLLFCGGGRFDLLIPPDPPMQAKLKKLLVEVETWLLETFSGELGLQFARKTMKRDDFEDVKGVYAALEKGLGEAKTRKWHTFITEEDFYVEQASNYHACAVCHLTPVSESGEICDLCGDHKEVGGRLPDTSWLAFIHGKPPFKPRETVTLDFGSFGQVWLLDDAGAEAIFQQSTWSARTSLYRINDTNFIPLACPTGVGLSFRFLANTAPIALTDIPSATATDEAPTTSGDVLDFDQIAKLSTGVTRLGILKADVDHMGLIFSDGLGTLTLSRYATLSRGMDWFFLGRLNRICEKTFRAGGKHLQKVKNSFYILYAGGDDLFIVGPWDQTMKLAADLHQALQSYACNNPNVTLSAGIVQVKPHHPIHLFARWAEERLEAAKDGRDQVDAFNHTMPWAPQGVGIGYAAILDYAEKVTEAVENNQCPRTFVYDIGRLYREYLAPETPSPMWIPMLHYAMRRRLGQSVIDDLKPAHHLANENMMAHAPILVNYVSLVTRKE